MSSISKTKTMIIKPDKLSYKILKWMQENEPKLKRMTGSILAQEIAEMDDVTSGTVTIEQTFSKMVHCDIVYRDKIPHSMYSSYRINYWHKSIPADILENAPVSVKRAMADRIDSMADNQYMDEEGCIVTPNAVEKTEDPFNEDGWVKDEEDDGTVTYTHVDDDSANIEHTTVADTASQFEEEPTTQEVSVPVEVKKDGKSMNITVNITLNL